MNKIHPSVELSVSNKTLKCDDIAQYLVRAGVVASITQNQSILCDNKKPDACHIEYGCRILFGQASKETVSMVWKDIKKNNELTCAHIKVPNTFSGCIYDFLRETKCPGNTT